MRTTLATLLLALAALAAPLALAQDNGSGGEPAPGEPDLNVDLTDEGTDVNVDDDDSDAPQESVAPFGNATVIILVVLGILVVALVVVLASRP